MMTRGSRAVGGGDLVVSQGGFAEVVSSASAGT